MQNRSMSQGIALAAVLTFVAGCSQPMSTREKGVLVGGGIGAATGAIIGAAIGNPGAGAAIGGAVGALGGGVVGDQLQKRDVELGETQQQITQQQQEIARNRQLIEELNKQHLEARETDRGVVVNLPDVLFEFGKANLAGDARTKIRTISDVLNNQAKDRQVSVEGHTDSIGSETTNQKLSERRAEGVAAALENTGVAPDRITAKGFGKRYPVAPNAHPDGADDPSGRAKNRRVEVIIENK
ncbi:MAG: OmpA family protein [Deltaproteobacteria bacterium]|nr:OmpA family protein [Deltaproteobacteria bacterium]